MLRCPSISDGRLSYQFSSDGYIRRSVYAYLYGAVDGQKYGVERPTVKARHSRKYFGRGKGMVAYT
ncbi:Tn3 family transposase, partial [Escherichia coli]